jgi:thymidylate synthase (FAD)
MKAKLISYSQAPALTGADPSPLDLVAYCARVSNPDNQNNTETNEKLVNYLVKHKHWSPLEMVSVCMEIETTRDIASQRYADPTKDLEFEIREARLQDPKNRQNSVPTDDGLLQHAWADLQQKVIDTALEAYNYALSRGIAKEQARAVLPEGNTLSRLYVNGTLRSWIHYIELRGANGTQLEHMELAWAVADAIKNIFPMAEDYVRKEI